MLSREKKDRAIHIYGLTCYLYCFEILMATLFWRSAYYFVNNIFTSNWFLRFKLFSVHWNGKPVVEIYSKTQVKIIIILKNYVYDFQSFFGWKIKTGQQLASFSPVLFISIVGYIMVWYMLLGLSLPPFFFFFFFSHIVMMQVSITLLTNN